MATSSGPARRRACLRRRGHAPRQRQRQVCWRLRLGNALVRHGCSCRRRRRRRVRCSLPDAALRCPPSAPAAAAAKRTAAEVEAVRAKAAAAGFPSQTVSQEEFEALSDQSVRRPWASSRCVWGLHAQTACESAAAAAGRPAEGAAGAPPDAAPPCPRFLAPGGGARGPQGSAGGGGGGHPEDAAH